MSETGPLPPELHDTAPPVPADAAAPRALPLLQRIPPVPFAAFSLALVFILYQFIGGVLTFLLFGGKVVEENVQLIRWATFGGQILFLLLPTLMLARLRGPDAGSFFRWRVPDYRVLLLTCVAVFALQQILQGYLTVQDLIPLPGPLDRFVEEFRRLLEQTYRLLVTAHTPGEFLVVILVAALTPAICEELLFRGLVQQSIAREAGGWRAAVITGVIFGAYHLSPFTLIPLIAIGIFLGFVVYRTGNILVAVFAHFFNNFLACVAAYLELKDDFLAITPADTPTAPMMALNVLLFGVVFVAATYYFVRITRPLPDPGVRGG